MSGPDATLRPVVVPAADVRPGELRWWCEDGEQIGDDVSHIRVDDLHDLTPEDVRDISDGWPKLAIVVRPDPSMASDQDVTP